MGTRWGGGKWGRRADEMNDLERWMFNSKMNAYTVKLSASSAVDVFENGQTNSCVFLALERGRGTDEDEDGCDDEDFEDWLRLPSTIIK